MNEGFYFQELSPILFFSNDNELLREFKVVHYILN